MKIEEGKELIMKNVLAYREKMTQMEMQKKLDEINNFINENHLEKENLTVTAIHQFEIVNNSQVIDVEILIPIKSDFTLNCEKYHKKSIFHLKNAVYVEHKKAISRRIPSDITVRLIKPFFRDRLRNSAMKEIIKGTNTGSISKLKATKNGIERIDFQLCCPVSDGSNFEIDG